MAAPRYKEDGKSVYDVLGMYSEGSAENFLNRGYLRWWICALLFASTVINYIDRQTLALLAPDLKRIYSWTNSDYAALGIAFRIAYSIGQTLFGRILDRIGSKRGLAGTVACYSAISILTSLANGFGAFISAPSLRSS